MAAGLLSAAPALATADAAYTLPNGLRVVMSPQAGNPVISARVMVKVGSSSESGEAEHGLAHLMEHMAFKGTAKRKMGEISSLVENNGGDINAYTSYDQTVYFLTIPAERLELALDLLSDMVFFPAYDPGEYAREKEVVIEEINRYEDNPVQTLYENFFAMAFPDGHPYGHRILGSIETVRNASRDTAFAFHEKYYRPDNAVLILTGGFDTREAKALADKYFGGVKNPEGRLSMDLSDTPFPGNGPVVRVLRSKDAAQPHLVIGFRCMAADSSEASTLDLLSTLLTTGNSSRMVEELRYRQGLVTSVYTSAYTMRRSGVFAVGMVAEPDKVLPAFRAALAELGKLSGAPAAQDELGRSRAITAKSFIDQGETPWALGRQLEGFELYSGDYRLKDAYLSEWDKVGPADLAYLAQDVFRPENMVVALLLPEDADSASAEELTAEARKLSMPPIPEGAGALAPAFREFTLTNGMKVHVMRDPSISLVELRLGTLGGRLAEADWPAGLSNLTAQVWSRASLKRKSEDMARAIESLGVSISGYGGRNTIGFEASLMGSNWREGLALFLELLKEPAFAEEDFQSKKDEQLAYLKSQEEDLPSRLFKILRPALYGKHPYSQDADGTLESVGSIKRGDLPLLYESLVRPGNVHVTVAGDIDPEEFVAALEEGLKDWKPAGKPADTKVPSPPPAVKGPVFASEALDRAQTHIALAYLAPPIGAGDQAAVDVMNAALSGMGGILFMELRDKKSLAYTVSGAYGPGLGVGSYTLYIGTSPDKAEESLSGMLKVVGDIRAKPLPDDVVEGAKTYLLGINKIRNQTLASRAIEALTSDIYGLGLDHWAKYQEAIAKVTPEDVLKAANKYLSTDQAVLAVVGTQASIDATRKLIGKP
ncbi:MAG: insulinase family protein [Deltaproteobacteria bacterium]|nr:insulinase family protein [Deltaproteobacteria bacterium]